MPPILASRIGSTLLVGLVAVGALVCAAALAGLPARQPACFGAAARDPAHPCANPRLAYSVTPTPEQAQITPNAPCTLVGGTRLMHICAFGAPPAAATATIALVGDSHASHWRSALAVVAQRKRWVGLSNTRSSCSFSTAVKAIGEPARAQCIQWNRDVVDWFRMHPEVGTVFVAEVAGEPVVATRGRDMFSTAVTGYIDAWNQLPPSVKHIVVIRDTPKIHLDTLGCVDRARARHERPGVVCAVARSTAIAADPAEVAAARMHRSRVSVIDMNRYICDSRLCYPVVGGVLVFKDAHHITFAFGTTLGPYLLREVNALRLG